jgi:hypothetical protein
MNLTIRQSAKTHKFRNNLRLACRVMGKAERVRVPNLGGAAGAKRLIDVEDACAWAFGQELPKAGAGAERLMPTLRELAGRDEARLVGPWLNPASYPEISPMFARGGDRRI